MAASSVMKAILLASCLSLASAQQWRKVKDTCILGKNIRKLNGKTLAQCKDACDRDSKCLAIEFYKRAVPGKTYRMTFPSGFCQLNTECGPTNACKNRYNLDVYIKGQCGVVIPAVLTTPPVPADKCPDIDADFEGNDLKLVLDVADWKACASNCKANGACAAFSYVTTTRCCYLKTGNTNRVVKTGVISGSSNCPVTVTVGGDECQFPFKYQGQEYKTCTTVDNGNTLWCATSYDYGKDKKWGNCKLDTI